MKCVKYIAREGFALPPPTSTMLALDLPEPPAHSKSRRSYPMSDAIMKETEGEIMQAAEVQHRSGKVAETEEAYDYRNYASSSDDEEL